MDKEVIAKSIRHYGEGTQLNVAMEECAELIQAVSKFRRAVASNNLTICEHDHLAEEIADVLISVELIQQICKIPDQEVRAWIDIKQKRIVERMGDSDA